MPPAVVSVPDLPSDVESAVGKASIADRSPGGRLQGAEERTALLRQFARQIDQALRPLLSGFDAPLAAGRRRAAPTPSSARVWPFWARLDEHRRRPGDEQATPIWWPPPGTCSTSCTPLLLRDVHELYRLRESESRAAGDLAVIARAATFGAIDTVLVDIDEVLPGTINEGKPERSS